jgi:hypothetical protein
MSLAPRRREYSPFTTACNPREICPRPTTRGRISRQERLVERQSVANPPGNWPYRGCVASLASSKERFSPFAQQAAPADERSWLEWSHDFRFAQVGGQRRAIRRQRAPHSLFAIIL